jgi:hypothetical protein
MSALMASVSPVALAATDETGIIPQAAMTFVSLDMGGAKLSDGVDAYELGDGKVCVDLDQFVRALEFQIRYSPEDQTARGWFLDETRLFQLDLKAKRILSGGIARPFPEGKLFKTELGLCVTADVLQDWFPVNLNYEPQGALISVTSREPLPVELRLAREERKRSLDDQLVAQEPPPPLDGKKIDYSWYHLPSFDVFGRAEVARDDFGNIRRSVTYNAIAVGELAKMTSEILLQSDASAIPSALRMRLYRRDAKGGVFGVPGLTDVTVGDVSGLSNSLLNISAPGRGVSLSSYPLTTSDEYDRTTLRGDMPLGWEAELYRNDALISYQTENRDGRFEFKDVPILFGINEFKIILYGPQGQRREERRIVNTGASATPRGRFYSRAVVQQDFRELINIGRRTTIVQPRAPLRFQAEGRYGLFNNLSLGGSISSFEQAGERNTYGALSAQTSLGRTFLDFEAISNTHGQWAAEATAQRTFGSTGIQLRHAQFASGFGSQKVTAGLKSRSELALTASLPGFDSSRTPLSIRSIVNRQYDGSAQLSIDEQASFVFGRSNVSQTLNVNSDLTNGQPTLVSGNLLYSRRLRDSGIRAYMGYELAPKLDLRSLGIGYDQYIGAREKQWYLNANADWQVREHLGTFSVGVSREFERFSLNVDASTSTRGAWNIGASISFSLSRDPVRQGWRMSSQAAAQSGNVIARIFEDMDNDGTFSQGDAPIKNAEILSDSFGNNKTDASGRIFLSGLPSDSITVLKASPPADYPVDLIEAKASNAVVARAGTVNSIDIPMIVSGSIEGEVSFLRGEASRPLRGIMVKLIGETQTIVQYSEYDGYYLFQNVPTGQYRVELDETQLANMGLAGPSMRGVEVSRSRPYPAGQNFRLEATARRPAPAVASNAAAPQALLPTRISLNGIFSDAVVSTAAPEFAPHIRSKIAFEDHLSNDAGPQPDHRLTLAALFGDDVMDMPLPRQALKPDPARLKLAALFGDEVMDLPLAPPPPPARKLPSPTIVVINPRFDDTLATQSKRADVVSTPIS